MQKRERLEKTFAGEATDRVPVALWRHFPGDDQRAADLARSVIEFQQTYDWDFVKVTPASSFCTTDYGLQDEWQGANEGTRTVTKRVIHRSLDWTELRSHDPYRGELGKHLECLRLVSEHFGEEVPVVATIFNPLAQAKGLAGPETLMNHMRTQPDRLHSGLNVITDATLRYIEALKRLNIAGIFYAVQHASHNIMSEVEYRTFGVPYDRKIIEVLPGKWWFNMLHLHGKAPMFNLFTSAPIQAINWHDRDTEPSLTEAREMYQGTLCGGLSREQHVHFGTPATIKQTARDAIRQTEGRQFILSTGCVVMVTSPLSNLRAVRESVEVVAV